MMNAVTPLQPASDPMSVAQIDAAYAKAERPEDYIRRVRSAVSAYRTSNGLTSADVARRADIASSTFSEFMNNRYRGDMISVAEQLEKWLQAEDASLETRAAQLAAPGYVETSIAREITQALVYAQTKPSMALITVGSGLGKTTALQQYQSERLHCWRVAIEPIEAKPAAMLRKIARILGVVEPRSTQELTSRVAERLRRDQGRQPLLMIDEAQNLSDAAVNQLRFVLDESQCGIALAGNEDLMIRYALSSTREGYGQIQRRIGLRVHVKAARAADVDLILDRMGVSDKDIRRLSQAIATRSGGYGQVVDTLQLAALQAYGASQQMTAEHVRAAWQNRSREDLGR